jgi:hypothetical protein
MNPFFDWLKGTGTQAMLVLLGTIAAFVAAIGTIYFGKKSLTKKDLSRIEENTEHLEEVRASISSVDSRLKKQEDAEQYQIRAGRVSVTARGNQAGNVPFELHLSLRKPTEPNLALTQVELYSEIGTSFGSFPCSRSDNSNGLDFCASIPMNNMSGWFHGGTPDQTSNRRRLKLRVWMLINGFNVSRDLPVSIIEDLGPGSPRYMLDGGV